LPVEDVVMILALVTFVNQAQAQGSIQNFRRVERQG
jgi:hypothetical protein